MPVDKQGIVDPEKLRDEITDKTILISVMYANGEIGTIQPIREIGKIARENQIYFHVDAVAAAGTVPINVEEENIDLLSISSNDMYGPKGVGALYIKKGTRIQPVTQGGGQERGLRSGTENIPGIVGIGKAAEIAQEEMVAEGGRLSRLRDKLIKGVLDKIERSYLNGHPTKRLPNNANLRFSYIEGESLILGLDMLGIQVSSGSACTSKTLEPSHVLLAIDLTHEEAHGSLVFTMGKQNSEEDVDYVLDVLPGVVKRLRAMSPLTPKEMFLASSSYSAVSLCVPTHFNPNISFCVTEGNFALNFFTFSFYFDRELKVYAEGQLVHSSKVTPDGTDMEIRMSLDPGLHVIALDAMGCDYPSRLGVSPDNRCLSLAIVRPIIYQV